MIGVVVVDDDDNDVLSVDGDFPGYDYAVITIVSHCIICFNFYGVTYFVTVVVSVVDVDFPMTLLLLVVVRMLL